MATRRGNQAWQAQSICRLAITVRLNVLVLLLTALGECLLPMHLCSYDRYFLHLPGSNFPKSHKVSRLRPQKTGFMPPKPAHKVAARSPQGMLKVASAMLKVGFITTFLPADSLNSCGSISPEKCGWDCGTSPSYSNS